MSAVLAMLVLVIPASAGYSEPDNRVFVSDESAIFTTFIEADTIREARRLMDEDGEFVTSVLEGLEDSELFEDAQETTLKEERELRALFFVADQVLVYYTEVTVQGFVLPASLSFTRVENLVFVFMVYNAQEDLIPYVNEVLERQEVFVPEGYELLEEDEDDSLPTDDGDRI
jgi:hypothetical protein